MKFSEIYFFAIGFLIGSTVVLVPFYFFYKQQNSSIQNVIKRMEIHDARDFLLSEKYDETLSKVLYNEVKLLCMVMTYPANHHTKAIHVKNTWGKRCNKIVFFSSALDSELDTIVLAIEDSRTALWNKTKASFQYLYDHFLDDYDWFMKADDDK